MEWFNILMDLLAYGLKGYILVYLTREFLPVKDRFAKYHKWIMFGLLLQYVIFYAALNYCKFFRLLFYNSVDAPSASRMSILPLMCSMILTILFCLCFYGGSRGRLLYFIFTYYTISELIMFMLHAVFSAIFRGIIEILNSLVISGNEWILQNCRLLLNVIQSIWELLFYTVFLLTLFIAARYLKRNLSYENREITPMQLLFLAVPCVSGMCFGILLRCILFKTNENRMEFLLDDYPESGVLITLISALCLSSIMISVKILKKLNEMNEKKILIEVYQNRISDMEEHMKDMEHLYDGIRGIRHDMKNYVADLEILLKNKDKCENEAVYQEEIHSYLSGIYSTMDDLEMKCSTGNPVTDVVISRKMRMAKEKNIPVECDFIYPEKLEINAFDISIILNNGLDNAIEAAEKENDPHIYLGSYVRENLFFIEMRNTFTGYLKTDKTGKNLCTLKEEAGHGLGLKNIKSCAAKYYGKVEWTVKDQEFVLTVMLQGKR